MYLSSFCSLFSCRFRVYQGSRVHYLTFGFRVSGFGFQVSDFRIQGVRCRVADFRFQFSGLGCEVQGVW